VNTLKYGLLLLGLFVAAPCARGQENKATASAKHTLWKVPGKQNAVYLLGSIHVLKKENYPLPAPIEGAFSNANIAVFETDVDGLEKPDVMIKLATKGRLPEGETLRDQLSPPVYAKFSNYLSQAGMPVPLFDQFAPAMAALSLVALELKKLDLDPEFGVDKHFFKRARQDGKKIIPLETIDFQIGLMTDFSKEEGELLMKTTLKDIDKMQKELGELLEAWLKGDSTQLEKLLNESMEEAPVIFKRLVSDRNQNWLPKIEELLQGKENAVVIVGAGHLVGANGVIELLRKKGYKVQQQ
jgi:uncharacterized protein YbaP (TraB family)